MESETNIVWACDEGMQRCLGAEACKVSGEWIQES